MSGSTRVFFAIVSMLTSHWTTAAGTVPPAAPASPDADAELTEVVVIGSRARARHLAGSAQVIDAADLQIGRAHV